ncbi:MAG TPA: CoA transferase [Marinobacter sp.]|uniref:CoA transferase n=2 Tax=root TaxID=1 RepID=A0A831W0L0_9GAMM|nr:CoA transferase [Marinobacter antarcticus]HDZ36937.1 CoA transferase [Marinobacter sp.]HEA53520.1 CoA transferase [Marinobacter antarcticus]
MLPLESLPVQTCGEGVTWLEGVKVLDLTTSIAGPVATMLLADLGADVLKVERPGGGDDTRHWGPPDLDGESLWFLSANRNKRSVVLNFIDPAGRRVLEQLIERADVVVVNSILRTQQKLGIDYESLVKINPKLVFVSITGFGLTGERANWTCYDLIAEGYSGVMDLTGESDSAPQKIGAPAADMLAAVDAAYATVGALFDAMRTGRSHKLDISLVGSMTRFLSPRIMSYLGSGEVPRRSGGTDSVIAVYQAFDTADYPITLGLGNDGIWKRFWKVLGRPEKAADSSRGSNAGRRTQRAAIVNEIQEVLIGKSRSYWLDLFRGAGIPAGPINSVDQLVEDEYFQANGMFYRVASGSSTIPQVGSAMRLDDSTETLRSLPPRLGQHTGEVLQSLGYGQSEIHQLCEEGVIEIFQYVTQ